MDAQTAFKFLAVMDTLLDEELGRSYRAADWPNVKTSDREREINRLAKSFEQSVKVNREAVEMSPEDLQALLSGHSIK